MRIILEGCDGTGKTTLAKLLADRYELDICHCTANDPADYDFYNQTARKENVIWDRHTIGELIYPKIFDREPQIYADEVYRIINDAKKAGVKIFILTADANEIKRRLERKAEYKKIIDNVEWINNQFLVCAKNFDIPVIDTSKMTFNDIFNLIESK